MVFKLLNSVITVCITATQKSYKPSLKSHFSCKLLTKQFCSKKYPDDSQSEKKRPDDSHEEKKYLDDSHEESQIEKLLKSSSPLRMSNTDDFWDTSPYPEGTVFRDIEPETESNVTESGVTKSVILFPGQGNQFVGMAKNLTKYPVALDMFKVASDILGYNLLKICLEGPEELLNDTKYCQPATFVCSLALLEKLKEEKPWAISNCVATCGYSLGELSALVFAGCMNFEKGLNLVKVRAEAMAECCEMASGGMLTIFTGPRTTLSMGLHDAIEHCKTNGIENPQCSIASYLFPNCKVIAGNTKALEFLQHNAQKYGIRRCSTLPVSGAFHTLLMKEAEEPFKKKLKRIDLNQPLIKVYSNVTTKPYYNVGQILSLLPKQIYSPVKWEQIIQNVLSKPKGSPLPFLYECGPGSSLTAVTAKINNLASPVSFSVQL